MSMKLWEHLLILKTIMINNETKFEEKIFTFQDVKFKISCEQVEEE